MTRPYDRIRADSPARQFLLSPTFTVAYLAGLLLLSIGLPLLLVCSYHLAEGHLLVGCSFGVLGVLVTGVSTWKLVDALARARQRYWYR